jgi:hypothetical protein
MEVARNYLVYVGADAPEADIAQELEEMGTYNRLCPYQKVLLRNRNYYFFVNYLVIIQLFVMNILCDIARFVIALFCLV